jgi:hypothetical protein
MGPCGDLYECGLKTCPGPELESLVGILNFTLIANQLLNPKTPAYAAFPRRLSRASTNELMDTANHDPEKVRCRRPVDVS